MKGSIVATLVILIAGVVLYFASADITAKAESNRAFMSLYDAAQAARQHKDIYASAAATPVPEPSEPATGVAAPAVAPNAPVALPGEDALASTDSAVSASTDSRLVAASPLAPENATTFRYPPFLALILMPLAFLATLKTAATVWFWANIALFVCAMFLSLYALSGKFGTGETGLTLVPFIISVPLIVLYLPSQNASILALVFVLAGLCLYKSNFDIVAGLVSSLALFSPLGVLFALYYVAKRAWLAVAGVVAGALVLFALAPVIWFGPQGALDQSDAYRQAVIAPLPAQMMSPLFLDALENQSLWAFLRRHSGGIALLGDETARFASEYQVDISQVRQNWNMIISIGLGALVALGTVLGVLRKIKDRNLVIVGVEGALVVMALLLLSPYTAPSSLVLAIFPLFAVVYVIRVTDIRTLVHHVNYVGLVLTAILFLMSLSRQYFDLGAIFAGLAILWLAILFAISRLRPHLVRGRGTSILSTGPAPASDRPIELAKSRASDKWSKEQTAEKDRETQKVKDAAKAKDKSRKGILPMPSFIFGKKKDLEGPASVSMEPSLPDAPPIELEGSDKDKPKGGGKISIE